MNQTELHIILENHKKWLFEQEGGECADLRGADLYGADLSGADLYGANLRGADLSGADLRGANLELIKQDIYRILDNAKPEVEGLLQTLRDGKINGDVYQGECACLVGTIANIRGCDYESLEGIMPNGASAAERWFLAIREGDTPEHSVVAKITEDWIVEWLEAQKVGDPS